jgi:hypothetical protein
LRSANYGRNDWMKRNAPEDQGWQFNGENVQRSRLRVDTRKWAAGKMHAGQYGDRQATEISGPAGGPIPLVQVEGTSMGENTNAPLAPDFRAFAVFHGA